MSNTTEKQPTRGSHLYQIHLDYTFYDAAQVPEVASFEFHIPRYGTAETRRARVHKTMKGAEEAVKKLLKNSNIFDPFLHDWRKIRDTDEVVEEQPEGPGQAYKMRQWTVYIPVAEEYEDLWPIKCDVLSITIARVEVVQ